MTTGSRASTPTRLQGRSLVVVRGIWIALMVTAVAIWLISIPPYFDLLRLPCAGQGCDLLALSQLEVDALRGMGLSTDFYAGYQIVWGIVGALAHVLLALLLFWRRSDEWVAIFVSLTLVLMAPLFFQTAPKLCQKRTRCWV